MFIAKIVINEMFFRIFEEGLDRCQEDIAAFAQYKKNLLFIPFETIQDYLSLSM